MTSVSAFIMFHVVRSGKVSLKKYTGVLKTKYDYVIICKYCNTETRFRWVFLPPVCIMTAVYLKYVERNLKMIMILLNEKDL